MIYTRVYRIQSVRVEVREILGEREREIWTKPEYLYIYIILQVLYTSSSSSRAIYTYNVPMYIFCAATFLTILFSPIHHVKLYDCAFEFTVFIGRIIRRIHNCSIYFVFFKSKCSHILFTRVVCINLQVYIFFKCAVILLFPGTKIKSWITIEIWVPYRVYLCVYIPTVKLLYR